MKDVKKLESINMSYSTHFLHVSKLKAIHKEQEFFRLSVGEKRRKIVDSIKRSETAKVTRDNTVLLRINSSHFEQLVLPMIQDKLDVKLFCLQRLKFLKGFSVEDLLPIVYHLQSKSYSLGDCLVQPGDRKS